MSTEDSEQKEAPAAESSDWPTRPADAQAGLPGPGACHASPVRGPAHPD